MRYLTQEEREVIRAALADFAPRTLGRERSIAETLATEFAGEEWSTDYEADYTPGAPKCNQDLMRDLMTFGPTGPLGEVFVVNAVQNLAERVAGRPAAEFDSPMINGAAWVRTAKHIAETMRAFYSRHNKG